MSDYIGGFMIEEASITFSSPHYTQLKCKIIDKDSDQVLSSSFISCSSQSYMPICRALDDFFIELWDFSNNIAKFEFTFKDLESREELKHKTNGHLTGIQLKKQTDSCCLYFNVYSEEEGKTSPSDFQVSNFHRTIANNYYKKLEQKCIAKVKKFECLKLINRHSIIKEEQDQPSSRDIVWSMSQSANFNFSSRMNQSFLTFIKRIQSDTCSAAKKPKPTFSSLYKELNDKNRKLEKKSSVVGDCRRLETRLLSENFHALMTSSQCPVGSQDEQQGRQLFSNYPILSPKISSPHASCPRNNTYHSRLALERNRRQRSLRSDPLWRSHRKLKSMM